MRLFVSEQAGYFDHQISMYYIQGAFSLLKEGERYQRYNELLRLNIFRLWDSVKNLVNMEFVYIDFFINTKF